MSQTTDNQSLTEKEYELNIAKWFSEGWKTMRKSAVYFVALGFLFIIIFLLLSRNVFFPISDFIAQKMEKDSFYAVYGIEITFPSLLLFTFLLLSRSYFYLAKIGKASFSFKIILPNLLQLCVYAVLCVALFELAYAPLVYANYLKMRSSRPHWEYYLLSLFLIIYLFTCFLFTSQLIMFGKLTFAAAIIKSIKIVHKNILKWLAFSVVLVLIATSGFLFIYIGAVFTIPLAACILSAAYDDLGEHRAEELDKKIGQIGTL